MSSVRQRVWNGKILIRVSVSEPESIGPQDYLLVASRVSYLYCYLSQILEYFNRYLDNPSKGDWWLEFNGEPIPFSRPIGLLHDMLKGPPSSEPWHIQLKQGEFPGHKILQFDSRNTLQSFWTNQFKESCYARDGNANAVMLLPREDHEALWWAINHASDIDETTYKKSFNSFWTHMSSLLKRSQSPWNVPIKYYIAPDVNLDIQFEEYRPIVQKTAKSDQTIGESFPFLMHDSIYPVLHGVKLRKEILLGELYLQCTYPDGFLHIAVTSIPFESS